jgi:hypothetical protein
VPAAAVIPAPRAYMNVVAVKKPVVGFESFANEVAFGFGEFVSSEAFASAHEASYFRRSFETCGIVHVWRDLRWVLALDQNSVSRLVKCGEISRSFRALG